MPDNIVNLSKVREDRQSRRVEEIMDEVAKEEEFIGQFAVQAAIDIVEVAYDHGFDINENPETIKDIMMIIESVAALMTRVRGEDCAFHDIPNGIFKYEPEECKKLFDDFIKNSGVFT